MKFLTSDTKEVCQEAANQIALNCSDPSIIEQPWAMPRQCIGKDFWFIDCPTLEGFINNSGDHFTKSQMLNNVVGMTEQVSDVSWFELGDNNG